MKKIIYLVIIISILSIGIISAIKYSDYLFKDEKIIEPEEYIKWDQFQNSSYSSDDNNITSVEDYTIFNEITESIKDIDDIEKINYDIFISNDSMQNIIQYYKSKLENEGYSLSLENSGITPYQYYEINYYTFIKGLNGVVIFIKPYNNLTLVIYTNGYIADYQNILDNLEI